MNATNFKTAMTTKMEILLEQYQNCEIPLKVNNQHNEYYLESALENIENVSEKDWEMYANSNIDVMSLAYNISTWKADESNYSFN